MRRRIPLLASLGGVAVLSLLVAGLWPATADPTLSDEEALGKAIFFDERLSLNQNQSCASCHDPLAGWVGPDSELNLHGAVYEGSIPGAFGDRKPPSSAYATQAPVFHMPEPGFFVGGTFWDGRATGEILGSPAAEQAQGPFLNPVEQALPDAACVVYRVVHGSYPVSFQDVWGDEIDDVSWPADTDAICAGGGAPTLSSEDRALVSTAYDQVGYSIAAYEGSPEVNAFTSKFDARRMGLATFTKLEARGFALFKGKGKCALCHIAKGPMPLFTDYTYDNLGIPANPENPVYDANPGFVDKGLGGFLRHRPEYAQYAEMNDGKFKVPTLRNVDLRPEPGFVKAFGHNGYFKSLEAFVHFYNTRDVLPTCEPAEHPGWVEGEDCWPPPEYGFNVNDTELGDLGLTAYQEEAIVAFLRTLSDGFTP
ncbi:MAG TPA: cytochrome c peroxidase [Actinomycetota bacterium]|nr:cytochrome c peroxidase [Actinomycetota bacterium]